MIQGTKGQNSRILSRGDKIVPVGHTSKQIDYMTRNKSFRSNYPQKPGTRSPLSRTAGQASKQVRSCQHPGTSMPFNRSNEDSTQRRYPEEHVSFFVSMEEETNDQGGQEEYSQDCIVELHTIKRCPSQYRGTPRLYRGSRFSWTDH